MIENLDEQADLYSQIENILPSQGSQIQGRNLFTNLLFSQSQRQESGMSTEKPEVAQSHDTKELNKDENEFFFGQKIEDENEDNDEAEDGLDDKHDVPS